MTRLKSPGVSAVMVDVDTWGPIPPNYRIETVPQQFWELLENDGLVQTKRAKVPGGWLIQQTFTAPVQKDNSQLGAMQFVSDPYHEWYLQRNFKE